MKQEISNIVAMLNTKMGRDFKLIEEFSTEGKLYFEESEGLSAIITDNTKNAIDAITLVRGVEHLNKEVSSLLQEGVDENLFSSNKLVYSRYRLIKEADMNCEFTIYEEGEKDQYSYSVFFDEALWIVDTKEKTA